MKNVYKFVAGNSRVTPLGVVLAVIAGVTLHSILGWWLAPIYAGVLVVTLVASTFEPVQ
jgi:predicted PurR-regulated permease PerM